MPHIKTLPGGKVVHSHKVRRFKMGGGAVCGANKKKRPGQPRGKCLRAAGWGTNHPGIGRCKYHGGTTPAHMKSAIVETLGMKLGAEIEIDPLNALMWVLRLTAGEMTFWRERVETIEHEIARNPQEEGLTESTMMGKQLTLSVREYRRCRVELAQHSETAIKLGLQERQVKMAEMYGQAISTLIRGILDPLMPYLPQEAIDQIPTIVRDAMGALEKEQLAIGAGS